MRTMQQGSLCYLTTMASSFDMLLVSSPSHVSVMLQRMSVRTLCSLACADVSQHAQTFRHSSRRCRQRQSQASAIVPCWLTSSAEGLPMRPVDAQTFMLRVAYQRMTASLRSGEAYARVMLVIDA